MKCKLLVSSLQESTQNLRILTSWLQVKTQITNIMNNIENWIDKKSNEFSEDAQKLFQESILCYKIKAYRASLLFSYLGFLTVIKELIIKTKRPDAIPIGRWDNILNKLKDEENWEQRVFQELTNSSNPIFNITESIRQQVKFWKDRRNDCAHFKENIIDYNHTDIFWAFIKSNLSKITIEGGKSNLLKKFIDHFDTTKTPPNKSYEYLILEIENAVENTELSDFFESLNITLENVFWFDDKKAAELYAKIFTLINNVSIKNELLKFIFSKENFDLKLLFDEPQLFVEFNYSSAQIREIWKKRIYKLDSTKKHYLLATLLRNNSIPKNELKETMQDYYSNFNQEGFAKLPTEVTVRNQLANFELLEVIHDNFFVTSQIESLKFTVINSKADLIALYIEYKKIEPAIVISISNMYKNGINPWWLNTSLENLFKLNEIKKEEYKKVCNESGTEMIF